MQHGKMLLLDQPGDDAFSEVSKFYSLDEDQLKSDHKVFTHAKKKLPVTTSASVLYKQFYENKQKYVQCYTRNIL